MQTEQITLDLGSTKSVGRVRLRSRSDTAGAFPKDFQVQISEDNVNFSTVHAESNFAASAATWYTFDFTSISARYVRILVTKPVQWGANFVVHLAEIEVYNVGATSGAIELTWVASGDDANSGTAALYDIRYVQGTSINFGTAIQALSEPAPNLAGVAESFTVTGLQGETSYTFAARVTDDAGNPSLVSNALVVATLGTPPGAVSDLQASNPGLNSMKLTWTAPFEDGNSGTAVTSYDLRYSTSPITELNFTTATQASGEPAPANPGTPQIPDLTVTGLQTNTFYYFALKSLDDVGNLSLISNVPTGETLDGIAPAAITDLSGVPVSSNDLVKQAPLTAISSSGDKNAANAKRKHCGRELGDDVEFHPSHYHADGADHRRPGSRGQRGPGASTLPAPTRLEPSHETSRFSSAVTTPTSPPSTRSQTSSHRPRLGTLSSLCPTPPRVTCGFSSPRPSNGALRSKSISPRSRFTV